MYMYIALFMLLLFLYYKIARYYVVIKKKGVSESIREFALFTGFAFMSAVSSIFFIAQSVNVYDSLRVEEVLLRTSFLCLLGMICFTSCLIVLTYRKVMFDR